MKLDAPIFIESKQSIWFTEFAFLGKHHTLNVFILERELSKAVIFNHTSVLWEILRCVVGNYPISLNWSNKKKSI